MKPNTFCSFCDKKIFKKERNLKNYKLHFCNRLCHQKYLKENSKDIIVKCNHCGKLLIKNTNSQRNSRTGLFFCNNLCKNRYLAKNKQWRKEETFSHLSRKKILYEKINFTCQYCSYNKNKKMLDIHHYDGNHNNNKIENLRVLCVWCHNLYHRLDINIDVPIIITKKELDIELNKYKKRSFEKCEKRIKKPKICYLCSKKFIPWNQKQKYCSYKCSSFSIRRVERPTKEELIELIEKNPMTKVGKMFDVSDNAIRKWARKYEINIKEVKSKVKMKICK
ncbi:hypothetical protein LCGC14_0934900 [marine sediment metagenome]|uniref:TRASH domain-containing protein n=1 Tax=marine sediment metagenome TaxID=412755 RepID=A0A0F9RTF4_9ZZZZ